MLDVRVSKNLKISGYYRSLFNHRDHREFKGHRDINVFLHLSSAVFAISALKKLHKLHKGGTNSEKRHRSADNCHGNSLQ